jgi:pimeloyl-ACP methyl ester carboxylesterase
MRTLQRRDLLMLGLLAPLLPGANMRADRVRTIKFAREGRETGYRLFLPHEGNGRWPVILFSHGARSSNRLYDRVLASWAEAGMAVLAPDHLDHDGIARPAGDLLWRTRLEDMTAPLHHRAPFDAAAHAVGGRLDWSRPAMAGHSYGALVAQILAGGIADPTLAVPGALPTIRGLVALSPPGPRAGLTPVHSWDGVTVPALLQTGDRDVIPGFIENWRQHKRGFDNNPGRGRCLAIGRGVDHFFGGLICTDGAPRDPSQQSALDAVTHVTRDFLRTVLLDDKSAARALAEQSYGPDLSIMTV